MLGSLCGPVSNVVLHYLEPASHSQRTQLTGSELPGDTSGGVRGGLQRLPGPPRHGLRCGARLREARGALAELDKLAHIALQDLEDDYPLTDLALRVPVIAVYQVQSKKIILVLLYASRGGK